MACCQLTPAAPNLEALSCAKNRMFGTNCQDQHDIPPASTTLEQLQTSMQLSLALLGNDAQAVQGNTTFKRVQGNSLKCKRGHLGCAQATAGCCSQTKKGQSSLCPCLYKNTSTNTANTLPLPGDTLVRQTKRVVRAPA